MQIDIHTHVQPPEYVKVLLNSGRFDVERGTDDQLILKEKGSRFLTITGSGATAHDPRQRLEAMDQAGIDAQVLSLSTPNVYFLAGQEALDLARITNDYLAEFVQQHPTRFRALANIPLTADIDEATAELVRCMDELGMPGFLIGANINGEPIDDPKYDVFYEEANRRGAVMFIHPMVPAGIAAMSQYALGPLVGFMFDTTLAVSRLVYSNFFGRFLGINVVAAHLGGAAPFLAGRLDAGFLSYPECQAIARPPSEILQRVFLDTATAGEPALQCAIDTVGASHVMFGSDYPQVVADVPGGIALIEKVVERKFRDEVLGDTAARLYRLGE